MDENPFLLPGFLSDVEGESMESKAMITESYKVKRPEHTFRITVSPVYYVTSCPVKLAEEAKGLMGFHPYYKCPDCVRRFAGWEFWGENGHMQGSAPTRERLLHWLKLKAREQSRVSGVGYYQPKGSRLGYRFVRGSTIYYRG